MEAVSQADMAAVTTYLKKRVLLSTVPYETAAAFSYLPSTGPAAKTYLPTIWHLPYRATYGFSSNGGGKRGEVNSHNLKGGGKQPQPG